MSAVEITDGKMYLRVPTALSKDRFTLMRLQAKVQRLIASLDTDKQIRPLSRPRFEETQESPGSSSQGVRAAAGRSSIDI